MWLVLFLTFSLVSVEYGATQSNGQYADFVDDVLAMGVSNLSLAIGRTAAHSNTNTQPDYLVYSPINIASALALILLGSNGKTFDELSNVLGLAYGLDIARSSEPVHEAFGNLLSRIENSQPKDTQLIQFANAVFLQTGFLAREQYRKLSTTYYKSETRNLDFQRNAAQARNTINNWVAEKTLGKIQDLVPDLPPTTKALLVSALYFKSEWEIPFEYETIRSTFYPNGEDQPSSIQVDMMSNREDYLYYNDSTLDCQILGLPYKGKTVTFYVVVPHNSNAQKLRDLEDRLTGAELRRLVDSVRERYLFVLLPKMKLTSTIDLRSVLENLGVKSLFDRRGADLVLLSPGPRPTNRVPVYIGNPGGVADEEPYVFGPAQRGRATRSLDHLRHLLDENANYGINPGLVVDEVLHKVVVDVNEKGTEAAAVTATQVERSLSSTFRVDVPFFFFIHHEPTKTILFWGSVRTPSPSFV